MATSKQVMDCVYEDLQSFKPYRVNDLTIIVPPMAVFIGEGQLEEMVDCCGVGEEHWHKDQGYFVLEHPA